MDGVVFTSEIPIPENTLRKIQKDILQIVPKFAQLDKTHGVKSLRDVIDPLLETADVVDLSSSHRAAACNTICAVIEASRASGAQYVHDAVLEDGIWTRLFSIYMERSDNAKPKSMRQLLLLLSNLISREDTLYSARLRKQATVAFLDVICERQNRLKAKPALQGLAHFLSKGLLSLSGLIELHSGSLAEGSRPSSTLESVQSLLRRFLVWITHNDTVLSASHLIKDYFKQIRQSQLNFTSSSDVRSQGLPFWVKPVVDSLSRSLGKIQDFKSHVFPHCFQPQIQEYLSFLLYLGCGRHLGIGADLYASEDGYSTGLIALDEFKVLLAAIQTGKEMGIVRATDENEHNTIQISGKAILFPDILFGRVLSHPEGEIRLAGLSTLVHSAAITKPITKSTFGYLKQHLPHLHGDTDANFRGEVLSNTQRLFDRLRASTTTLAKPINPGGIKERLPFPPRRTHNKSNNTAPVESLHDSLQDHLEFITWYLRFMEAELRPTASYQRHTTALKSLLIVIKSGLDPDIPHHLLSKQAQGDLRWVYKLRVLNPGFIRSLLDLLLDPFDDVRNTAASILALGLETGGIDTDCLMPSKYARFLARAETSMLKTGRADQADGVARSYSVMFSQYTKYIRLSPNLRRGDEDAKVGIFERLVNQLEETILVAQENLSEAVNGRPVHGIFSALRYIIDQPGFYREITSLSAKDVARWKQLHHRIRQTFKTFWLCVQHVLCNDAPEGYVPEELEEEVSITTKEILSYSWRGLKEASVLLKTIISAAPMGTSDTSMFSITEFEILGELCFTQLAELRHRGAFSTVSQTFATFCRRCMSVPDEHIQALPLKWYQETLLCIQDKATAITRRSAGIPSLMAAIISADPDPKSQLFSQAMCDLFAIASLEAEDSNIQDSRLPQVHALNCIKDIFTTSRLSVGSEAYLSESLDLAARTLNSKIWPIRNCSLMLFKALIERLVGSGEVQLDWKDQQRIKTSRFSYDNYPNLVQILSDILDRKNLAQKETQNGLGVTSAIEVQTTEGVFPALQILQQAPPPETHRSTIRDSVLSLTESPHWHLRDMAARTLASLLYPSEHREAILILLGSTERGQNMQHGVLLCLKYIFRLLFQQSEGIVSDYDLEELLVALFGKSRFFCASGQCPLISSAYLDIVNLCGRNILFGRYSSSLNIWKKLVERLEENLVAMDRRPNNALLDKSIAESVVLINLTTEGTSEEWPQHSEHNLTRAFLLTLAKEDSDTCCETLDLVSTVLRAPSCAVPVSKSHLFSCLDCVVANTDNEAIKSAAQFGMAEALSDEGLRSQHLSGLEEESMTKLLDHLEYQSMHGPPTQVQTALRLQGYILDALYQKGRQTDAKYLKRVSFFIKLLRKALDDRNPFDMRYAAVLSLSGIDCILKAKPSPSMSPLILGFSLVLYDMLNDDDDEIREAAAPIATKLMVSQGYYKTAKNTAPTLTTQHLVKFMTKSFSNSSSLFKESLRRLTDTPFSSSMFKHPVKALLAAKSKEDTALFIQEKQNLFKDDTLEAVTWCHIAKSFSPNAVNPKLLESLAFWVMDGIATLKETAQSETDGALGWTSKADIFALGMRVICAVDILLKWLPAFQREVEVKGWQVRKALREFADVGEKAEVSKLWLDRVEGILAESVMNEMGRVVKRIGGTV
ncbi:HEAT repeat protein-like protein [Delitschia confertaspora ATCC 74209]|uniref:HEAT repeat protein-like protein n=1 Tax=Delitschia confertaspora ATCC 74209 TaxID=1513339 RepID=A0A9P4JPZ8_9PLEO|nr:HEAT repeat protein-like protein [Delitschia confertaspora ATCC 74209]